MFETDLLAWLQNSRFIENGEVSMRDHLANLVILKEQLAEIDCPLSDASFASYIRTSLSLAPSFKPLLTTLTMNAHITKEPVSSQDLIWHINEEANNAAIENSINQHHEAMIAAHAKAKGESKDTKKKSNSKGKSKDKHHCSNCGRNGHTNDQCFEEGGGMAGKAPDWWVKKHKGKGKGMAKSANAAENEDKNDDNYAFLTYISIDAPNDTTNENVALAVTSGHSHEAHAASPTAGIIIDCGA
ncbi:hypothetical protein C0993_012831, partial [Termitomyces sp. T159_Od127]